MMVAGCLVATPRIAHRWQSNQRTHRAKLQTADFSDILNPPFGQAAPMPSNSDQERGQLELADRHIAELRQHIARQRRVITKLRLAKEPTDTARSKLAALEGSLRVFERHRELILNNLKKAK
jgi:hypothetical protein